MLPALYLLLAPLAAVPADDPPVRLRLSADGRYLPGERARVWVEAADDGYLVVLRADGSGRVRVLFPLDPGDDAFARGGREYELRGRGDRDAFFVDDREGTGIVLAAWSRDPFRFDEFVRGDHWDYRLLGPAADDPDAGLLDIVHRMAGGAEGGFEYDEVRYSVGDASAYYGGYTSPYRFGVSLSFGYPSYGFFGYPFYRYYGATGCYGPAFYGPWGMCPYGSYWFSSGSAFFFDVRYPFGYGYPGYHYPYRHHAIYPRTTTFGRPVVAGSPGFLIPRKRELVQSVQPRAREARSAAYQPRRGVGSPRGVEPVEPRRGQPRGGVYEPRRGAREPDVTRSEPRRLREPRVGVGQPRGGAAVAPGRGETRRSPSASGNWGRPDAGRSVPSSRAVGAVRSRGRH